MSHKIKAAKWGEGVITEFAKHLALTQPNLKACPRPNLFLMHQFFKIYQHDVIISLLMRPLPKMHNFMIISYGFLFWRNHNMLAQQLVTQLSLISRRLL